MDRSLRSQFPSIKLDQLVYVELDASNGGMMLTVSEDGFSFRAVSPVRTTSRTPFSFVINGAQKLEGFGKIEWTKDDGKVAGLQFTDVTSEFLNSLRIWLAQLCSSPAPPAPTQSDSSPEISYRPTYHPSTKKNGDHVSAAEQQAPQQQSFERPVAGQRASEHLKETVVQPLTSLGLNLEQVSPEETRHSNGTARISAHPVSVAAAPVLSEWSYPEAPPRSRGNGLVIAAALVCLMGLAILLYSYREVLGQTLISLGQKMSATSETSQSQTSKTPETPKPVVETQQPATPAPATAVTQPPAGTQPQSGHVNDSSYSVRDNPAPAKPDSTFQDARRDSIGVAAGTKGTLVISNSADQIRSLWSAVSQGNTSAEVTLAKLYLIGGGVPKSCDQAKILLQAAAKKGNGEAIDKLSQISQQGCP
jgi:TPR repeat protein